VSSQKGQVGVGQVDRRWPAIIPGVVFRCCQPGSDWSSTQSRRIHRLLLITLPSIPLLVAAVVAVVFLQNRYDILSSTQVAYLCLDDVNEGLSYNMLISTTIQTNLSTDVRINYTIPTDSLHPRYQHNITVTALQSAEYMTVIDVNVLCFAK